MKNFIHSIIAKAIKRSEVILLILLSVLLFPFLMLNFFNNPTTEDFYYGELLREAGFSDSQRFLHKYWGGRFFTYIWQCFNPLFFKSVTAYKISTLLLMIAFVVILFMFISKVCKELLFRDRLMIFLSVLFLYLFAMPSVSQGFYWYGSVICYNFSIMLFLMLAMFYMRTEHSDFPMKLFYTILCVLSAIAIGGTSELTAVFLIISLTLLFTKDVLIKKRMNWYLFIILAGALISVIISFTLPGNRHRGNQYVHNYELYFSVVASLSFLGRQLLEWMTETPLIVISFMIFPVLLNFSRSETGRKVLPNPLIAVLTVLVLVYSGIFVMLWSVGIVPYDRILNLIYFVFIFGWFFTEASVIRFVVNKYGIQFKRIPGFLYAVAAVVLAIFMLRQNNIISVYSDLFGGAASDFSDVVNARYEYILNSRVDSVTVDPFPAAPKSFFYLDITTDPGIFYNVGYAKYFKKKAIMLRKAD